MQRVNYFYNVPESKKDCDETECNNCEHMRCFLIEASEYKECYNEKKKMKYVKSVKIE